VFKICIYRTVNFVKQWLGITIRDCLSPFSLFSLVASIVGALYAVQKGGQAALFEQINLAVDGFHIFTWTMAIFFPISLVASFFKTVKERRDQGQWREKRYTYNLPRLIKTLTILPVDDGKYFDIDFLDVPKRVIIGYKIEYHGGIGKVQIGIVFHNQWDWIQRQNQSGSFAFSRDPKILVNCPSDSDLTTVRVYQTFWEIA
jgi:hypothetical protein